MAKKVDIGAKPVNNTPTNIEQWVSERSIEPEETKQPQEKMKRLTLDIPESLHRNLKKKAADEGVPMADMLRQDLTQKYGA